MEEDLTFGKIVDMNEGEFREFLSNKDLGFCISLYKLMCLQYQQLVDLKDKVINDNLSSGLSPEQKEGISNVYLAALKLEGKCVILHPYIKQKEQEIKN